jgi:hypothetical protein
MPTTLTVRDHAVGFLGSVSTENLLKRHCCNQEWKKCCNSVQRNGVGRGSGSLKFQLAYAAGRRANVELWLLSEKWRQTTMAQEGNHCRVRGKHRALHVNLTAPGINGA